MKVPLIQVINCNSQSWCKCLSKTLHRYNIDL